MQGVVVSAHRRDSVRSERLHRIGEQLEEPSPSGSGVQRRIGEEAYAEVLQKMVDGTGSQRPALLDGGGDATGHDRDALGAHERLGKRQQMVHPQDRRGRHARGFEGPPDAVMSRRRVDQRKAIVRKLGGGDRDADEPRISPGASGSSGGRSP